MRGRDEVIEVMQHDFDWHCGNLSERLRVLEWVLYRALGDVWSTRSFLVLGFASISHVMKACSFTAPTTTRNLRRNGPDLLHLTLSCDP
jgi:hypothetical protein